MTTKKKTKRRTRRQSLKQLLEPWLELDLTAAAKAGEIGRAFEADDLVEIVGGLIEVGRRPVLMGEPGVGKTAIVHELVRKAVAGEGPPRLRNTRVLQISLERRASSLKGRHLVSDEMQKLVEALRKSKQKIALFIRDLARVYDYDLEPQLVALAYAFRGPLLGEGTESDITTLLECDPALQSHFLPVRVDEPTLDQARVITRAWAEERGEKTGVTFSNAAVEQALVLSDRFLTRSRMPRKAIDTLDQAATLAQENPVSEQHVFDRFCSIHRTPRVLVDPRIPLNIDQLEKRFAERIVGQGEAIELILKTISVIKAGLTDDRRPLGTFLWTGPTGVGKTYAAQLLTEFLFGNRDRMVRLNMADYKSDTDAAIIFGRPHYESEEVRQGKLARVLMSMPFGVILLDEFEKAHLAVHDRFLQLLDEGTFINGNNETVSCRSWIIIATSNAGWESTPLLRLGFNNEAQLNRRKHADVVMAEMFRQELLGRFDSVVHFRPLGTDDLEKITEREIVRLSERRGIEQRRLQIEAGKGVVSWILRHCSLDHGARSMRRTIETEVISPLADLIVRDNPQPGSTIVLLIENDRIVARRRDAACPRSATVAAR